MERSNLNTNPDYKVAILAAGRGTRLGSKTADINKALLPLGFKAILSHIVEKFPVEIELVVALGFKKEEIKNYLGLAHPERRFTFVEVDNYDGPGSGPGYSLLCCEKVLGDSPFIITTVDTLVKENVPPPTEDWLGIALVASTEKFNSVRLKNGLAVNMQDKKECDNTHAFIGLCGIKNTELFWKNLKGDGALVNNELQLSNGLKALVAQGVKGMEFTWFDTGDEVNFKKTWLALYPDAEQAFDFSKKDEFIYFVNGKIVKYFRNPDIAAKRVKRAGLLAGFVPKIEGHQNLFYSYKRLDGNVLYASVNDALVEKLLQWLHTSFWKKADLDDTQKTSFKEACRKFYYDKTLERIGLYFKSTGQKDEAFNVNGERVPSLESLVAKIPWQILLEGVPGRFHGDLQFDNILVTPDSPSGFVMIDWRQDFGGLTEYGDIYYDLAKLYGGILLPYDLIKKGAFSCTVSGENVELKVKTRLSLLSAEEIFKKTVSGLGYDMQKIRLLTSVIFLNMSPLHEAPFNVLLHHLGKRMLHQFFEGTDQKNWLDPMSEEIL